MKWHHELGTSPELGPSSAEVVADARTSGYGELDYVGTQVYAEALLAERFLEFAINNLRWAARTLRATTFFRAFELDPESGVHCGHRLAII